MSSIALRQWWTVRSADLDEIAAAHAAIEGHGVGRRYATQRVNHAYAVLLAAQFQGFCRDLHSECADHLTQAVQPAPFQMALRVLLAQGRQLDAKNATPASVGADFNRFGLSFWDAVAVVDARKAIRLCRLEELNRWRNAIAHQDFDPALLGGTIALRLQQVQAWRSACNGLAQSFDRVMRRHVQSITGIAPW